MANNDSHFIRRFKFDFEVEDREKAKTTQEDLSRIFTNSLERILEEALDEFEVEGHLLRIQHLELDLGDLSEAYFESDLVDRFRNAIRKELEEARAKATYQASYFHRNEELIPLWPAKLDMVSYFLEFGRLPASASGIKEKVDQVMSDLIREIPMEVRMKVRELFQRSPYVAKRLVEQFPEPVVEQVFRVFNESFFVFIQREYVAIAQQIATEYGLDQRQMLKLVQEASLVHLVKNEHRTFNRGDFFKSIRSFVERRTQQDLERAFPAEDSADDERRLTLDRRYQPFITLIRQVMTGEVSTSDIAKVVNAFEVLVRFHSEALKEIVLGESNDRKAFYNLIRLLPTASVHRYIQQVSPGMGGEVLRVALRAIAAHSQFLKGPAADTRFRDETYTSLLQYVSQTPSSSQSGRSFSEFLKAEVSDLEETPEKLIETWGDVVGDGDKKEPLQPEKESTDKEEVEAPVDEVPPTEDQEREDTVSEEAEVKEEAAEEKETEDAAAGQEAGEEPSQEGEVETPKEEMPEDEQADEGDVSEEEDPAGEEGDKELEVGEETGAKDEEDVQETEVPAEEQAEEGVAEEGTVEEEAAQEIEEPSEEENQKEESSEPAEEVEQEIAREGGEEIEESGTQEEGADEEEVPASDVETEAEEQIDEPQGEGAEEGLESTEKDTEDGPEEAETTPAEEIAAEEATSESEEVAEPIAEEEAIETGDSERTRIDFVLHILETGEIPWWGKNLVEPDPIKAFSSLVEQNSREFLEELKQKVKQVPAPTRALVATRMLEMFGDTAAQALLKQALPEIFGLYVTVSLLVERYRKVVNPNILAQSLQEPNTFRWYPILRFYLDHIDSIPGPPELIKYVVRMVAATTGTPAEETAKVMRQVVGEAVKKGEMRFLPIQTMLPRIDQPLDLETPTAETSIQFEEEIAESLAAEIGREEETLEGLSPEEQMAQDAREEIKDDPQDTVEPIRDEEAEGEQEVERSDELPVAEETPAEVESPEEAQGAVEATEDQPSEDAEESELLAEEMEELEEEKAPEESISQDDTETPSEEGEEIAEDKDGEPREEEAVEAETSQDDPGGDETQELAEPEVKPEEEEEGTSEDVLEESQVEAEQGEEPEEERSELGEDPKEEIPEAEPSQEDGKEPSSQEEEGSPEESDPEQREERTQPSEPEEEDGQVEEGASEGEDQPSDEEGAEPAPEPDSPDMEETDPETEAETPEEAGGEDTEAELPREKEESQEDTSIEKGEEGTPEEISKEQEEPAVPEEEPLSKEEIEEEIRKILDEPEISREETVIYYLKTGTLPREVAGLSEPTIWAMINEVIGTHPDKIEEVLREQSKTPGMEKRIANLPVPIFEAITRLLIPEAQKEQFTRFFREIRKLFTVQNAPLKPVQVAAQAFRYLAREEGSRLRLEDYIRELVDHMQEETRHARTDLIDWLAAESEAKPSLVSVSLEEVLAALRGELEPPLDQTNMEEPDQRDVDDPDLPIPTPESQEEEEEIYVNNAGLILFVPMLSRVFKSMKWLDMQGRWVSDAIQERSIHFLAYLSHKQNETREEDLVLNKLMTGWELKVPVKSDITLTEEEMQVAEDMIDEIRGKWRGMENTKNDTFRGSWLQRDGRLRKDKYTSWVLRVDQKAYDILLNRLPYSVPMFDASWTSTTIRVEWQ